MKTIITALAAMIFLCATAFAQSPKYVVNVETSDAAFTKFDDGFIKLKNGETLDGLISLKIVKEDTVLIRFKKDKGKKVKYNRSEVLAYGLHPDKFDVSKKSNNPAKNFTSGYVILRDGTKKEGMVRVKRFYGAMGHFAGSILISENQVTQEEFDSEELAEMVQVEGDKKVRYIAYRHLLVKCLIEGKATLVKNPFPTTSNGFLNEMLAGVTGELADDAAEHAAKKSLEKSAEKGIDNMQELGAAVDNAANNAKNTHDAISGISFDIKSKEYLIMIDGTVEETITKDNCKSALPRFLASCPAYTDLSKKEKKSYRKFVNVESAIKWYNKASFQQNHTAAGE